MTVNGSSRPISSGNFSMTISLVQGANVITIVAKDSSPNQNTTSRTLTVTVSSPTGGGGATKVAFAADFGPSTTAKNVIAQIPTDSSLAFVVNGGDNYDRGANDAATPTNLTTEIGFFTSRGLASRLIATPGNHDWYNRNITPGAGNNFQGFLYCYGNASGLAAGNAGHTGSGIVTKQVNGWTIIVVNTVITETATTLDGLVGDSRCGVGPTQLTAIAAALPTTGRKCLVFGHHPVWNADSSDHTDGTNGKANQLGNMRGAGSGPGNANFWQTLQGKAMVYTAGHAHNMQLHQPRDASGNVSAAGVTQIVAGSAGGLNYSLNGSYAPAPVWVDGGGVPGYVLFDCQVNSVGISFIGQTGQVLKSVTLAAS